MSRGGVFSSNIFVGNRKGFYGVGQDLIEMRRYSDPWTARKAVQARHALMRRGAIAVSGFGQDAAPPPPEKMKVGLMVGWGVVLLASVGVFYAVAGGKRVAANRPRRRRSSRRRSTRRNARRRRSTRRRSTRRRSSRRKSSGGFRKYKALSATARRRMPDSSFALSGKRFPIKGPPGSSRERDKWQAYQAIRYLNMGRVGSRADYLAVRNAIIRTYGPGFWRKHDGPSWSSVEKAKRKRARTRRRRTSRKIAANSGRRRRTSRHR